MPRHKNLTEFVSLFSYYQRPLTAIMTLRSSYCELIKSSLKNNRSEATSSHRRSSEKLTSVKSLAYELISRIFMLAAHDSHDRYDAILYPIVVSHVCAAWRQIAISTNGLWTSIILTYPSSWFQLSRTVTYLSRSRSCPLDIFLDFRDPLWNWEEHLHRFGWKEMENVTRLLLPHVERWHSVELLTDTWAPIFTFLSYMRKVKSVPVLESISLSRCNVYFASKGQEFSPAALRQPIPLFEGASGLPALRTVILAGVHVDWPFSNLRNLKKLELKYHASNVMPTLEEFVAILAQCPDLEYLTVLGWGPQFEEMEEVGNTPLVALHCLKHLAVGFVDAQYAIKMLSIFNLPKLNALTIEDISCTLYYSVRQDVSPILDSLITTNADGGLTGSNSSICLSNIRSLELRGLYYASSSSLTRFLRAFTALHNLSIIHMNDEAFSSLESYLRIGVHVDNHPRYPTLTAITCKDIDYTRLLNFALLCKECRHSLPRMSISLDIRRPSTTPSPDLCSKLVGAGIRFIRDDISVPLDLVLPP